MEHDRPCGCKHAKPEIIERLTVLPREEPLPEPWRAQIEGGELSLQVVPQGDGQVLELTLRRTWPVRDNVHAGFLLEQLRAELRADPVAALGRMLETRPTYTLKARRSEIVEQLRAPPRRTVPPRRDPFPRQEGAESFVAEPTVWTPMGGPMPQWRDSHGRVLALQRSGPNTVLILDSIVIDSFDHEEEALEEAQRIMEGRP